MFLKGYTYKKCFMKNLIDKIEDIIVSLDEVEQSYNITINDLKEIIIEPRKDDKGNIITWGQYN